MARLLYSDPGSHLVYQLSGRDILSGAGRIGTLYEDAAGTVLADIATYDPATPNTPGAVIGSSQLTVDTTSRLPWFWGPASGQDELWVTVNGGPLTLITSYYDPRIDALAAGSVPGTRQVIAGAGLTGGGALSADVTLDVDFGNSAGTVTEGNDARLSDARTPTPHASSHLPGGTDALTTAVAGSSAVGDAAAAGSAASFSRSDHVHGRESFGAVTAQTSFGASSGNGAATTPSRSDHVHGTPTHDGTAHSAVSISSLAAPTGSVAWGSQKITSLANGTAATDAAAFGQIIPASLVDAKGDLIVATADNTVARLAVGSNLKVLMPASDQTAGLEWFDLLTMLGYLSAEQESLLRTQAWSDSLTQATGNVTLAYWTARQSVTITAMRAITGSTAAGATPTLCKIGLYSVAGNGDLTRVAQITSDTSLFAGTYTSYQRNLAASVSVTRGNRYASALLVVTGATAPKMRGYAGMPGNDGGAAPRVNGIISGQTDLSSSYTSASVANTDGVPYIVAVP
jgi:hypothetical protein